ncbi:unnamed protein product [Miscanthus lutarioriparius]|nr:unnamed protein product [Miscanthus lutarioriparius]
MDPSSSSGFGVPGFMDPEEDNANAMGFDFFSQLDSMPPPSNAAGGMEFFAANVVDLDLNSEAPDYPHL